MEIIKKNILSILCGVVALVAVIASMWPMGSYQQGQQETLRTRAGMFRTLDQLRSKARNKPVLNPDSTAPESLERFPNDATIEKATEAKKQFEAESKKILDAAIAMNRHEPLVPGVLPKAETSSPLIYFREAYKDYLTQGIAKIMKAGALPTEAQITEAKQKLREERYKPAMGTSGTASQSLEQAYQREAVEIPDRERTRVASESLCYMEPTDLIPNPTIQGTPGTTPAPSDVWFAQLGLWIYTDAAKAIAATNEGSKNVMEAPVKRVLKMSLGYAPDKPTAYILPANAQPGPIEGDANAPVPKMTEVSPTGRVCNPLYDVVAFELIVDVDAEKIPWLLRELENKRFVSIHAVDVTSVDSIAQRQAGYFYGEKPVAQLRLQCEEIMFRDWSHKLMPEMVAKDLRGSEGGGVGGSNFVPGITPGGMPGAPGGLRGSREMY
jgi:hypothetical protein